ncbi:MAG: DUF2065 domain-containing protein [Proteobacteria bacterium]|nr:DUF2065 domain-containing protein [Pseudomonadota bacterium]
MPEIAWSDLGVALGLVLAIEGAALALFTRRMKTMMRVFLEVEDKHIRTIALLSLISGLIIVWIIRG